MAAEDALIEGLVARRPTRPTLGNEASISLLQARAALLSISPGASDLVFFSGKRFGEAYAKSLGKKGKLEEGLGVWADYLEENKAGIPENASCNEKRAVVRVTECAFSHGLPDIGMPVCHFDAGFLSGFLSAFTGRQFNVREVRCNANGDEYCEFEIREYRAKEAFEEAFRVEE